jgi:hypothetical protein
MIRHHRRIRTRLATAVAIATPLALASSASATRVIEPTLPGSGRIHHVHVHLLRVSGATRTNLLTGVALNPISGLGPGAIDAG